MPVSTQRPAPLRTDASNDFAHRSMHTRVPAIIRETQQLNPDYPPLISDALNALHDALQGNGPLPPLPPTAPDYDSWSRTLAQHKGATWLNTEWFVGETYFYRQLVEAVRWWETGRDPFAPKKAEEISSDALWNALDHALAVPRERADERLAELFQHALWGNRIDLSYSVAAAHGSAWMADDLLVDDRQVAVEHVLSRTGTVHIITDNAGTELAMDLVLVDALLDSDAPTAEGVVLHVKLHPTYVSDATATDVLNFIHTLSLTGHNESVRALGDRLEAAFETGRLRLAPHFFWNSGDFLWELPPRLLDVFRDAIIVIIKGDANYRRMVGDALWPPETPFREVVSYFPAPLLALRTMKSDPVVSLPQGLSQRLDSLDPEWRLNGRRGVIHCR
ncbi:MAG: protein-glutamate O-methyltransferase family protein, partial [Chloroflexi bacterium]|nr:protein-glutamate O-methyltransferase family protein [Chloroflexota bacterium]